MIDRAAIKRQQLVLKHLGYYHGEIDGIWSKKSMEAKIQYERSGKFNPGIPNNGMPFNTNVKLPQGLYFDPKGYVAVFDFDVDTLNKPVEQPKVIEQPKPVEQKVEPVQNQEPAKPVEQPKPVEQRNDRNQQQNPHKK